VQIKDKAGCGLCEQLHLLGSEKYFRTDAAEPFMATENLVRFSLLNTQHFKLAFLAVILSRIRKEVDKLGLKDLIGSRSPFLELRAEWTQFFHFSIPALTFSQRRTGPVQSVYWIFTST
jgi:hypothetical protein